MKTIAYLTTVAVTTVGLLGMYAAAQGATASRSSLSETIFVLLFAGSGVVALVGGTLLTNLFQED